MERDCLGRANHNFRTHDSMKKRAKRIPVDRWEKEKEHILKYYAKPEAGGYGLTLDNIIQVMREKHKFSAGKRQYTYHLKKWDVKKNRKQNHPEDLRLKKYIFAADVFYASTDGFPAFAIYSAIQKHTQYRLGPRKTPLKLKSIIRMVQAADTTKHLREVREIVQNALHERTREAPDSPQCLLPNIFLGYINRRLISSPSPQFSQGDALSAEDAAASSLKKARDIAGQAGRQLSKQVPKLAGSFDLVHTIFLRWLYSPSGENLGDGGRICDDFFYGQPDRERPPAKRCDYPRSCVNFCREYLVVANVPSLQAKANSLNFPRPVPEPENTEATLSHVEWYEEIVVFCVLLEDNLGRLKQKFARVKRELVISAPELLMLVVQMIMRTVRDMEQARGQSGLYPENQLFARAAEGAGTLAEEVQDDKLYELLLQMMDKRIRDGNESAIEETLDDAQQKPRAATVLAKRKFLYKLLRIDPAKGPGGFSSSISRDSSAVDDVPISGDFEKDSDGDDDAQADDVVSDQDPLSGEDSSGDLGLSERSDQSMSDTPSPPLASLDFGSLDLTFPIHDLDISY